jgi:hypothetical protein
MKLGELFKLTRVKQYCTQIVKKAINEDTIFKMLEEAKSEGFTELLSYCKNFLEINAKKLFQGEK